jgi:putative hydrolase of the HAD superfamily
MVRERLALPASAVELLRDYRRVTLEGFPPIDPAVRQRLASMRALGWKLAVVTNGEAGVQEATARRVGVDSLVDACVVSDVVGIRKPDPRIFELAAEMCGHPLAGAWMVGDGDADVIGANASGIRSVWLARGRRWERADVEPTAIAHSMVAALDHVTAAA